MRDEDFNEITSLILRSERENRQLLEKLSRIDDIKREIDELYSVLERRSRIDGTLQEFYSICGTPEKWKNMV
jgi:hypothetical protein